MHCRLYVYEAAERIMANASPNMTQQLLDRSIRQRNSARSSMGLICGKDKSTTIGNDSIKATALYLACKHLPTLSSPECLSMLVCAAKTLEKIGDKRRLGELRRFMKILSNGTNN